MSYECYLHCIASIVTSIVVRLVVVDFGIYCIYKYYLAYLQK